MKMRTHSGDTDEHSPEDGKATTEDPHDTKERGERGERGETGDDDLGDAIAMRIRRASRVLTTDSPALERDLGRVRTGLGLDHESIPPDSPTSSYGGGEGSNVDPDEPVHGGASPPRGRRDLERELMLAATRRKLDLPEKPVVLGDYQIQSRIGGGGMGVVWRALDPDINKTVALKLLRRGNLAGQTSGYRQRAREEASAQAQSQHRYVADVISRGELDGQPYIVMEYVEGVTLSNWRRRTHPLRRPLLSVYRKIALGLLAIHNAKIAHGDFKHDNVLITQVDGENVPKIIDFGMALEAGNGIIGGTPEYMAPEQLTGAARETSPKSDQYAFCVALFEDLVDAHPYAGVSYDEFAVTRRQSQPNLSPDKLRYEYIATIRESHSRGILHHEEELKRLPRWLQKMLRRGLSPRAEDRFESMQAIVDLLLTPERSAGRRKSLITALSAGALALVLGSLAVDRTEEDPCAYVADASTEIWGETIRASLPEGLRGPAKELLEPHARAWQTATDDICNAHHQVDGSSDHTFDVQRECLAHRKQDAKLALEGLKDGGDLLDLRGYLRPPALCKSIDRSTPNIPSNQRDSVHNLQARLKTEVLSAEFSGNYAHGEELAAAIYQEAAEIGYWPLIAESRYYRARLALNRFLYAGRDPALRLRGEQWLNAAIVDAARVDSALWAETLLFRIRYSGMVPETLREPIAEEHARLQTLDLDEYGEAALEAAWRDSVAVQSLNLARPTLEPTPPQGERADPRKIQEEKTRRLQEASDGFEFALRFYRKEHDQVMQAKALENLGTTRKLQDKGQAARQNYADAAAIWRQLGVSPPSSLLASILDEASDIEVIATACSDLLRRARKNPSEDTRLEIAKVQLICATKAYGHPRRAMPYALQSLRDLPPENRPQALEIILHLDVDVGERTPEWIAQIEQHLDGLEPDLPAERILLKGLRGRLQLHREKFSSAADRFTEARELMVQRGQERTDPFTAAVLLLDLVEAQVGAGQPSPHALLDEAKHHIERLASTGSTADELAPLRERHSSLNTTSP